MKPAEKIKIGKMRSTTGMGISPSGEWLVATGGAKAYVSSTASMGGGFTKFVSNDLLTCLAFHPTEDYFATGDRRGQIRLWYCLDPALMSSKGIGEERRAQTTTLHWHAHAVSSIAFSGNGAYLLSGGEEAVLVIWQVHSGKHEYVPRVGAPISSIAVATHQSTEEEFLLVLADGTLAFVSSGTLRIARSFARIKHGMSFFIFDFFFGFRLNSSSRSQPMALWTSTACGSHTHFNRDPSIITPIFLASVCTSHVDSRF